MLGVTVCKFACSFFAFFPPQRVTWKENRAQRQYSLQMATVPSRQNRHLFRRTSQIVTFKGPICNFNMALRDWSSCCCHITDVFIFYLLLMCVFYRIISALMDSLFLSSLLFLLIWILTLQVISLSKNLKDSVASIYIIRQIAPFNCCFIISERPTLLSVNPMSIFRTILPFESRKTKKTLRSGSSRGTNLLNGWMDISLFSFQAPCSGFVLVVFFAAVLSLVWISGQRERCSERPHIGPESASRPIHRRQLLTLWDWRCILSLLTLIYSSFLSLKVCVCAHLFVCVPFMHVRVCTVVMACIKSEGHISWPCT